jgi:hypothetical protein
VNHWDLLDNVNEWVRFADVKAGAVLTLSAASIAFLFGQLDGVRALLVSRNFDPPSVTLLALCVGYCTCLFQTVRAAFEVILPRVAGQGTDSLLHFEHIAITYADSPADYVQRVRQLSAEEVDKQTLEQVVAVSRIAKRKFECVSKSMKWLAWTSLLWVAVAVCLFIVGQ